MAATGVSLPFLLSWLMGFSHLAFPRLLPHRATCIAMIFPALCVWFSAIAAGLLPRCLPAEAYPLNYAGPLCFGTLYAAMMRVGCGNTERHT